MERAARRNVRGARQVALDEHVLFLDRRIGNGHGGEQGLSVGMQWVAVEVLVGSNFHKRTQIHDADAIGNHLDDGKVVGDEQIRQVVLLLNIAKKVQNLSLNGHVESRNGLVGHDELRVNRKRAGDADTLTLAAGELVRIALAVAGRKANDLEQLLRLLQALALAHLGMDKQRLADDVLHLHAGIKRSIWILEHHLHLGAQGANLLLGEFRHVLALKENLSLVRRDEVIDQATGSGLAAAGLAYEREGLARHDVEGHVVHRMHELIGAAKEILAHRELLAQVTNGQQWLGLSCTHYC